MLRRARPRKRISLTSLVDVIFLLLLFFMLTSTFSKFSEVPLSTAATGSDTAGSQPIFLQLYPQRITVNGEGSTLQALALPPQLGDTVLVALKEDVTAQRLTDLLVALRRFPDLTVTVLGSG